MPREGFAHDPPGSAFECDHRVLEAALPGREFRRRRGLQPCLPILMEQPEGAGLYDGNMSQYRLVSQILLAQRSPCHPERKACRIEGHIRPGQATKLSHIWADGHMA